MRPAASMAAERIFMLNFPEKTEKDIFEGSR